MKTRNAKFAALLIVAFTTISFLLNGCQIDSGHIGPVGPEGPAGNANVKSVTFKIYPSDWVVRDMGSTGFVWDYTFYSPLVTSDIVNYGAVLFYMKDTNGDNAWASIPSTFVYSDKDASDPNGDKKYFESYDAWYSIGAMQISYRCQLKDGQKVPDYDVFIKAVVIADYPYALLLKGNKKPTLDELKHILKWEK
jgi:hypothetical protein